MFMLKMIMDVVPSIWQHCVVMKCHTYIFFIANVDLCYDYQAYSGCNAVKLVKILIQDHNADSY